MNLSEFLNAEWRPAMGCTEPAAVAWAACLAAGEGQGPVRQVRLVCDPRTYKNCYAVGLPNSGHRTGILWALGIGAHLGDTSLGLRSFEGCSPEILDKALVLMQRKGIQVEVDAQRTELLIDVTVTRENGDGVGGLCLPTPWGARGEQAVPPSMTVGRALLEREHTRLARLERDGQLVGGEASQPAAPAMGSIREAVAAQSIAQLITLARSASAEDRRSLREGAALNLAIADHGMSLLPPGFVSNKDQDSRARLSCLVSAGVHARMSGEPMTVMSLAGSGNKGITVAVPVTLWGQEAGHPQERIDEALAFACLMTSAATYHLGTLSAVCGAANAAGIGIAAALVLLGGGSAEQVGLAVNTMVGNVAGMVCDGAKIGCAMKTMTGVDAAFRAASLALAGVGIPDSDGIVGRNGEASLVNLGRLAQQGMAGADAVILDIMQDKLRGAAVHG